MADHRISQMRKVQQEALELFMKKNRDYGDSFARYGPVGVLVRLGDKVNDSLGHNLLGHKARGNIG